MVLSFGAKNRAGALRFKIPLSFESWCCSRLFESLMLLEKES
jgi:hypothetical protein